MADDADLHAFGDDRLCVTVAAQGAELQAITDARFGELLWDGGPAWPRRSPVLFPIVGRLNGDALRVEGRSYRIGQHGFARDRRFAWVDRAAAGCRLVLEDDAQTRAAYPFAFRLEVDYRVAGGGLTVAYRLTNPGLEVLPASLGAHPAFRWPLADGVAPDAHRIVFAEPEREPIRRLSGGLLDPNPRPTPIDGRTLALHRGLFAEDAIILDRVRSRALRYEAPGAVALEIAWDGFQELGLWTKPDSGDFLCIEPWRGFADPVGFAGELSDKPGVMHVAPGETRELSWSVRAVGDTLT